MTKTAAKDFENGFDTLKLRMQPLYGLTEDECSQLVPIQPIQRTFVTNEPHLYRASSLLGRRESESWEALTYAVLWLCALWTITLCGV